MPKRVKLQHFEYSVGNPVHWASQPHRSLKGKKILEFFQPCWILIAGAFRFRNFKSVQSILLIDLLMESINNAIRSRLWTDVQLSDFNNIFLFFLMKIQMQYTSTFLIKSNCIIALKVKAMLRWRLANFCILKRGGVSTSKDLLLMWPPYLFTNSALWAELV